MTVAGRLASLIGLCAMLGAATATLAATPAAFRETASAEVTAPSPAAGRWWAAFEDPVLSGLIERAEAQNQSIPQAAAHLAEAQARVRAVGAARAPHAGIGLSASHQSGPLINAAGGVGDLINLGGNVSYTLDVFGRLAKDGKAARLDAQASAALLENARLFVAADVAQTYFQIRALDEEARVVDETLRAYKDGLALSEGRQRSGLESELSLARARSEIGGVESEALVLARERAALEHDLAFLIGAPATSFQLQPASLGARPPPVPPGLPSAVLARRADVDAAQRTLDAARLRLGLAKTAWLPSLTLTGSDGYASSGLSSLLNASALGLGAQMLQPLFDGGQRRAGVERAAAEVDLRGAEQAELILAAFRDVETQLSSLRLLSDQAAVLNATLTADQRAGVLLQSRVDDGMASKLDLIDARRQTLDHRRIEARVRGARYIATVNLIRAIGGGW